MWQDENTHSALSGDTSRVGNGFHWAERSKGTDGATGTRRLRRKRSEAMNDAVCDEQSEETDDVSGHSRLRRTKFGKSSSRVLDQELVRAQIRPLPWPSGLGESSPDSRR